MLQNLAALLAPGGDLPACDPRIAKLHRYWRSIRPRSGLLPSRQHFDPAAIPRLLPWIWPVDVHRAPLRFKYRLVGTEHVIEAKSNPTGRWYDEAHPQFAATSAYPHFVAAAERGETAFYRGPPVYVIDAPYKTIERLIVPLARNGRDVDMLVGLTVLDPH